MKTTKTVKSARAALAKFRAEGRTIVLVPTMGCLHEGHLSLIRKARKLADRVVVSIFVNPTQFGPNEDFKRYPRPLASDSKACAAQGVDLLFIPAAKEMYADDRSTYVEETALSADLCGRNRPGHFRGVATVVLKLLNIVRPDAAVFGRKDFQQLCVIRRMCRDLNIDTKIICAPIVREKSGLAMSSRNAYLSAAERADAKRINRILKDAAARAATGKTRGRSIENKVRAALERLPSCRGVDYAEVRDAKSLAPLAVIPVRPRRAAVLAVALHIGKTRLIDNILLP